MGYIDYFGAKRRRKEIEESRRSGYKVGYRHATRDMIISGATDCKFHEAEAYIKEQKHAYEMEILGWRGDIRDLKADAIKHGAAKYVLNSKTGVIEFKWNETEVTE
jgi:hypothetical protein